MTACSQPTTLIGLAIVVALASAKAAAEHAAVDLPAAGARKQVHFSNGPRAVPRPRGAALQRAQALGIGGHTTTKQLLWSRPGPALMEAVPGARPRSLLWPVVGGRWGRGFGYTRRVRTELRHNGIDIGAAEGAPVRAAAAGLVIYSDNTLENLGNAVIILHPGGWTTLYGHNLRNTVQPGWYVKRGERIALVGQTGAAWGPHLHFELRDNGRWRDPKPFITGYRDESLNGPLVELSPAERRAAAAQAAAKQTSPHPTALTPAEPSAAVAEPTATQMLEPELPFEVGTLAAAQRVLGAAAGLPDEVAIGRKFSNLLWPVTSGGLGRGFELEGHRALDVNAAPGTPVRVAADGIVIYSGAGVRGYGHAVVVLHRNAWVTVYAGVAPDAAAEAGSRVLRGEWIGRVADGEPESPAHLHFEWRVAGEHRDPGDHFVGR